MPTSVNIDGVSCSIEKLADGSIRVTHESHAYNAMHGQGTEGLVSYQVNPAQRTQHAFLNSLLPPSERTSETEINAAPRPWWSLGSGQGGKE